MGGSSLCPEVLALTYAQTPGFPRLHILDSTDPAQIRSVEKKIDLAKTLFIVSSKSGSTLEPNIYKQYFFDRVKQTVGADKAGSRFIAITDPGSKMQQVAERDRFRHIFYGLPTIGGRYSALSNFGMVPAAAMGLDTGKFLERTKEMVDACKPSAPAEQNPGVMLGLILGTRRETGRDKITLIASPGIADLGAWLEQLIAESTGKLARASFRSIAKHWARRTSTATIASSPTCAWTARRCGAGRQGRRPRESRASCSPHRRGRHLQSGPGILPLGNCDRGRRLDHRHQRLQSARRRSQQNRNTQLTSEYESKGSLPAEKPILEEADFKLFTDDRNAADLAKAASAGPSSDTPAQELSARASRASWRRRLFGLLGYIEMNAEHESLLQAAHGRPRRKAWRPASASVRVSCTLPDKPTKAARIAACSCKSPATMPRTCRFPIRNTRSAW